MRTKTLWIKPEYLQQILDGSKTIEVRVGYSNMTRLQVGDQLLLNGEHLFVIERIGRYASFAEMLENEPASAIAPNVPNDQLLDTIRTIYSPEKESLGVVTLAIVPLR